MSRVLRNELGHEIMIGVDFCSTPHEVVIIGVGPSGMVEHTWTLLEALEIHEQLGDVLVMAGKNAKNISRPVGG